MRPRKKDTSEALLRMHPDRAHEERLRRRGVSAWLLEWVPPEVYDGSKKPQDVDRRSGRVVAVLSSRLAGEAWAAPSLPAFTSPASSRAPRPRRRGRVSRGLA